jgi:DNA-binding response OmpR family regulator
MPWNVVSIDDLPEVGELVQVMLRHPEIVLHQAREGQTGLALIRQLVPDLVLLDLMLPGMSGWDIYDAIRADEELHEIPVIILSVLTVQPERHLQFLDSKIDLYVTKPFDTRQLRRCVIRMLNAPNLWE